MRSHDDLTMPSTPPSSELDDDAIVALLKFAGWGCEAERDDCGQTVGWQVKPPYTKVWVSMATLNETIEYFLIHQRLYDADA